MSRPLQYATIPDMRDADEIGLDGVTYTGAQLRARIAELEAELAKARKPCLHQISEPAGEYPPLPEPRHRGPAATGSYFDAFTADQMRAYVDADRAMREGVMLAETPTCEGASYESMNLAVMVLSDCGHSSNYKPLLERVAGRIDRHVERLLTAQHADRAMLAQAAPAAVAGPSDSEIDALVASIGPTEGIRRDSRDLIMDKLRVLVRRALATWGHVKVVPVNAWQQAIDHELVTAHLGVAGAATLEEARKALHELICWHIDVATDPATNGGKVLVDAACAPADSVLEDASRESEYRRGYLHGYEQRDAEVRGALA